MIKRTNALQSMGAHVLEGRLSLCEEWVDAIEFGVAVMPAASWGVETGAWDRALAGLSK